jgi:hypothetical protein
MNMLVDRFYRHRVLNGGVFTPIHTGHDLIEIELYTKHTMPYWGTQYGKSFPFFSPNDNKLYVLFLGFIWTNKWTVKMKTYVLRLRTRKNPQLLLGNIRHLKGDSGVTGNVFTFFYNANHAVDNRRNIIVGEEVEDGKPDWLLEYELEKLFS